MDLASGGLTHPELSDLHGISKQVLFNLLSVTLLPAINLKRPELRNWRGCGVRPGG
ncbi:MAG TPA: hypothetical protein VJ820_18030 [Propionibacteriaceae bacterium]|nr:hypothetical protein [Propionibacteriaceae bacterium]